MKTIKPYVQIAADVNSGEILKKIEAVART